MNSSSQTKLDFFGLGFVAGILMLLFVQAATGFLNRGSQFECLEAAAERAGVELPGDRRDAIDWYLWLEAVISLERMPNDATDRWLREHPATPGRSSIGGTSR